MHRGIVVVVALGGCIEGPEGNHLDEVSPRPCEDNLAADQTFEIAGRLETLTEDQIRAEPPSFALDGPTGTIAIETTVGAFGTLTLRPTQPLPPDADLSLRLVDRGVLGDAFRPGSFPAAYSTRAQTRIRGYRAIDGRVAVSFTQPLDAASVATSVVFPSAGQPAMYLDSVIHEVVLTTPSPSAGEVDIVFGTALRTRAGAPVFATPETLRIDADYSFDRAVGCENFDH